VCHRDLKIHQGRAAVGRYQPVAFLGEVIVDLVLGASRDPRHRTSVEMRVRSIPEPSAILSGMVAERGFRMVRGEWEAEGSASQCCRGDEGRPLEVGVQKLASNQAVLLWSKDMVVSNC